MLKNTNGILIFQTLSQFIERQFVLVLFSSASRILYNNKSIFLTSQTFPHISSLFGLISLLTQIKDNFHLFFSLGFNCPSILTLQACPSSFSAIWASVEFWMTRPPVFPEKSMATRLASDLHCSHTHTHKCIDECVAGQMSKRLCVYIQYISNSLYVLSGWFLPASLVLTWTTGSYSEAASHADSTHTHTHYCNIRI